MTPRLSERSLTTYRVLWCYGALINDRRGLSDPKRNAYRDLHVRHHHRTTSLKKSLKKSDVVLLSDDC
jgi:hypothetical protein